MSFKYNISQSGFIKSEGTVTTLSKKEHYYSSGMALKTQTAIPNFILGTGLNQCINLVFRDYSIGAALALLNLAVEIPMQLQKCLHITVTAILSIVQGMVGTHPTQGD